MKTFETEKHNIPKGATHYWNESCSCFFAWWNDNTKEMLCPDGLGSWSKVSDLSGDILHEIPKPRTKTEFVKCEFNHAWEAVKAFEDGEDLYTKRSHKDFVLIDNAPDVLRFLYDLHRKVENEIDERQEFIEALVEMNKKAKSSGLYGFFGELYDSGKFKLVE